MEILSQNSQIVWRIFRTKSPVDASQNSLQNSSPDLAVTTQVNLTNTIRINANFEYLR